MCGGPSFDVDFFSLKEILQLPELITSVLGNLFGGKMSTEKFDKMRDIAQESWV